MYIPTIVGFQEREEDVKRLRTRETELRQEKSQLLSQAEEEAEVDTQASHNPYLSRR